MPSTGSIIDNWIEPRPATYALNKINGLEEIKLNYFTMQGCREAVTDTNKSVSHNTLAFTRLKTHTIAICLLASIRLSWNIRNDEEPTKLG